MLLRRKTMGVLAAGMAAALTLTACGSDDGGDDEGNDNARSSPGFEECADDPVNCNGGEAQDGGEITWAISAGWEQWNGNQSTGNSVYVVQALEGILPDEGVFLPNGEFEWSRDLFASEPELISEEPQAFKYTLREEAVWNDGTPISRDDYIWNWYSLSGDEAHCTAGCDSASTTSAAQIESIETGETDQEIIITLKEGEFNPEWMFGGFVTYPAHIAEREAPGWQEDPEAMAASAKYFSETTPDYSAGPYIIESARVGEQVVKVPNPEWFGETKPTLDKVIQVAAADQQATLTAIQNGEYSGASPASLDPEVAEQAQTVPGVYSNLGAGPSWEHIDINTTHPWLKDIELRKAIFTAINVDEINKRTYGTLTEVERRTNHTFRGDSPYHEDLITATGQGSGDVEAAKEILTAAGYEISGGKLMKDGQAMPAINFRPLEGHTMRQITAEQVQAQLKEIGIEIQIKTIPSAELSPTLAESDFDMVIFGWSGTPAFSTGPAQFWHSTSGSNFGKNKNEELDELLDQIRQTPDLDTAAERTNAAIEKVVESAYILPIATTPVLIMVQDKFVNVRDTWASSLRAMYNMEEWGVRAQ